MPVSTTIIALATAPHPAGVAIIRISGPKSSEIISKIFISNQTPAKNPRKAILGTIIDPTIKNEARDNKAKNYKAPSTIDTGICIYMPGPNSFTGEDVAELQIHGSPIIAKKIIALCLSLGCVSAEPGEFTKRAFLKGKLDLSQAEAVSELINATSENALKIAQEQLSGRMSKAVETIGEPLRDLLAELTAGIDFSDEDIEPETLNSLLPTIDSSITKIKTLIETYDYGATVKEGYRILLCGKPNVGKSSLFNLLLNRQRAIVTEVSGTTRDVLEEEFVFEGYKFLLCDSAGVRETEDIVEKIGVELARQRVTWADLILFIVEANEVLDFNTDDSWQTVFKELSKQAKNCYLIINKIDSINEQTKLDELENKISTVNNKRFFISVLQNQNIDLLKESILNEVKNKTDLSSESGVIITCERHRDCLLKAMANLKKFKENVSSSAPIEIVVEDLRATLSALEEIVGRTFTEDILGRVFSKFCVGK